MPASTIWILRIILASVLLAFFFYLFFALWKELGKTAPGSPSGEDLSIHVLLGTHQKGETKAGSAPPDVSSLPSSSPSTSDHFQGPCIVFRANAWWVEGTDPAGSVLLNGAPLFSPMELQDGDELRINAPAVTIRS